MLMAEDFNFAVDWYFWGQNRLGSFVPFLGSFLVKLGFNGFSAIVFLQYALLTLSFFILYRLTNNKWLFFPLLILTFFPHSEFKNQVLSGHPYLAQIFFCNFLLLLLVRNKIKSKWGAFLFPFVCFLAIWSSEISIASILAFIIIFPKNLLQILNRKNLLFTLLGLGLGLVFLLFAKNNSVINQNFDSRFASLSDILTGLDKLVNLILDTALFQSNKFPHSILFYLIVTLVAFLIAQRKRLRFSKLSLFFLVSSVLSFGLIILSNWWTFAEYPLRYFIPSFLNLALFVVFLLAGSAQLKSIFQYTPSYLLSISIALSGLYLTFNFALDVPNRATQQEMKEICGKGNLGIIGSYWNTYCIQASCENVKVLPYRPYARRYSRNKELVFEQDSLMVIQNGLFDTLSDTLEIPRTGFTIKKVSENEKAGRLVYAFYKPINPN
jgi:hypothetical protein